MTKKRSTSFQHHYAMEFGFRITEQAAYSGTCIVAIARLFCGLIGKEKLVEFGRKYGHSAHIKYFKARFWKEKYLFHSE